MSKPNDEQLKPTGDEAAQRGQDVPQHKRLAQGDPLSQNQQGRGVDQKNA
jgi:hypothetical protein